jgi:protein-disulfide isomerase
MRLPTAFPLRLAILALVGLLASAAEPRAQSTAAPEEGVLGSPDAPVTITEFSSLTCPHCAAFHKDTLPGLKERYIDTGKVKLVLRDFPLDETALRASMIAHCAGPDRYAQFVDVFFQQQATWARASDPIGALKQLARLGGLAPDKVDACLADQALENKVLQARLEAQQTYDISSTPTFVIDGKTYAGDRSVDEFAEIIDPLLTN